MSKTNTFKKNLILGLSVLFFAVSFTAIATAVTLLFTEKQEESIESNPVIVPLVIEPNRIDFQGKGPEKNETHERTVHLINQSNRPIDLLFTDSSCRCSAVELPGNRILPGEKIPMKCTLSTAGRISDRAGGDIWIAYRFADAAENNSDSTLYTQLILTAIVE